MSIAGAAGAVTTPLEGLATVVGWDITPPAVSDIPTPSVRTGYDGVVVTSPDGSVTQISADGATKTTALDGTVTVTDPTDGPSEFSITSGDGSTTTIEHSEPGDTQTITVTLTDGDMTNKTVTHISSDEVITINYTGDELESASCVSTVDDVKTVKLYGSDAALIDGELNGTLLQTVTGPNAEGVTTITTKPFEGVTVTEVYDSGLDGEPVRTNVTVVSGDSTVVSVYDGRYIEDSGQTPVSIETTTTNNRLVNPFTVTTSSSEADTVVNVYAEGFDHSPSVTHTITADHTGGTSTTTISMIDHNGNQYGEILTYDLTIDHSQLATDPEIALSGEYDGKPIYTVHSRGLVHIYHENQSGRELGTLAVSIDESTNVQELSFFYADEHFQGRPAHYTFTVEP